MVILHILKSTNWGTLGFEQLTHTHLNWDSGGLEVIQGVIWFRHFLVFNFSYKCMYIMYGTSSIVRIEVTLVFTLDMNSAPGGTSRGGCSPSY